jgi:glutamate N-acetyltransferase/amino-acid N-acetyltransferase
VLLLANGLARNKPLQYGNSKDWNTFQAALDHVTRELAYKIVLDGEGVTRFVEVVVRGAQSLADARRAAEAIANSNLVKCAWYGGDPNWGRIMDAVGYSGAKVREELVDIFYDGLAAVREGVAARTPVEALRKIAAEKRFTVTVDLNLGTADHIVYTTDLTADYVEFNKGE